MNEKQNDIQEQKTSQNNGSNLGFYVIMMIFGLALVSIVVFSVVTK